MPYKDPEKKREYYQREWERNRRATDPEWAERKRERGREYKRTRAHGITREQRDWLYREQDGRCAGCREPFPSVALAQIDHDHECCPRPWSCGKCIRALLCPSCNKRDALAGASHIDFGAMAGWRHDRVRVAA